MADTRSDFEAEYQRFADLLRWTDGIAALAAEMLLIVLALAWWTG